MTRSDLCSCGHERAIHILDAAYCVASRDVAPGVFPVTLAPACGCRAFAPRGPVRILETTVRWKTVYPDAPAGYPKEET